MRLAYADPPYPGQSAKLYRDHPDYAGEVDHAELVYQLEEYDGWALSTNNRSLPYVLGLCPNYVHIAAWCNPNSQPFSALTVTPSWEPVVYTPARKKVARARTRDYLVTSNLSGFVDRAREHVIVGQKPPAFICWLFDLLGAEPTDDLDDLFPGSGSVKRGWEAWRSQTRIPLA